MSKLPNALRATPFDVCLVIVCMRVSTGVSSRLLLKAGMLLPQGFDVVWILLVNNPHNKGYVLASLV